MDPSLIAETNRLLTRLLDLQEEQRVAGERFLRESEERSAEIRKRTEASLKEGLMKAGLSAEDAEGSEADWERRREAASLRTRENIETLQRKDEEHKAALLAELGIQSDLLRRIAERLEA